MEKSILINRLRAEITDDNLFLKVLNVIGVDNMQAQAGVTEMVIGGQKVLAITDIACTYERFKSYENYIFFLPTEISKTTLLQQDEYFAKSLTDMLAQVNENLIPLKEDIENLMLILSLRQEYLGNDTFNILLDICLIFFMLEGEDMENPSEYFNAQKREILKNNKDVFVFFCNTAIINIPKFAEMCKNSSLQNFLTKAERTHHLLKKIERMRGLDMHKGKA